MIYDVEITHTRTERIERKFSHRAYLWLVDLDHLPELPWWLRPFARFEARDHIGDPKRSIRDNIDEYLRSQNTTADGQILMLANARVLGYVFNPLTVFWCHDEQGELRAVIAEVHNTYQQRHAYLLQTDDGRAQVDKAFYVSPFLDLGGHYVMRMPKPGARLSVTIALRQNGKTPFSATMRGSGRPATKWELVRTLVRMPLMTHRVSALIRRHGIALYLRRMPITPRSSSR